MSWILIYVITYGANISSGTAELGTEANCREAGTALQRAVAKQDKSPPPPKVTWECVQKFRPD